MKLENHWSMLLTDALVMSPGLAASGAMLMSVACVTYYQSPGDVRVLPEASMFLSMGELPHPSSLLPALPS